jgi:hypothetical protein
MILSLAGSGVSGSLLVILTLSEVEGEEFPHLLHPVGVGPRHLTD